VFSDRTRGNRHNLKDRKFHLNKIKTFFTIKVVEHGDKLPKDVVEITSLEILKTHMEKFLSNLPWMTLL